MPKQQETIVDYNPNDGTKIREIAQILAIKKH